MAITLGYKISGKLDVDNFGYVLDNDNRYLWPYAPDVRQC